MSYARALLSSACLLAICFGIRETAAASTFTQTGTFTADNDTYLYSFTAPAAATYTFYTTSYGGGVNADGTTSTSGGFVPVLTLFTGTSSPIAPGGLPLGNNGGSGMCLGGAVADGSTGICDDAYLQLALTSGDYILALTEFPNVAINNLSDGFLFASDPNATGTACGVGGGTFLESDVAPCVQRDGQYALNVSSSAVPEPATWALVLPAAGALFFVGRQHLS